MNKVYGLIKQYNAESIARARALFEAARSKGFVAESTSFDDAHWVLKGSELQDKVRITFYHELPIELEMQVKCYLAEMLYGNYSNGTIKRFSRVVLNTALHVEGDWNALMQTDMEKVPKIQTEDLYHLVNFLKYIGRTEAATKVKDEIEMKNLRKQSGKRDLPDYNSLILLDFIIYDYFTDAAISEEDLTYFYPILIWWEIGNVIPMRSTEYCALKRLGIYEKGGQLYCEFPVIKDFLTESKEVQYESLAIDGRIKELADKYCELVDADDPDRQYLFSVKPYLKRHPGRWTTQHNRRQFVDRDILGDILDDFLREVVTAKYEIPIVPKGTGSTSGLTEYVEDIQLGDPRHLAMYNMMRQGLDPAMIMKIARHKHLASQNPYTGGVEAIIKSEVEVLALMMTRKSRQRDINLEMAGVMRSRSIIVEQMQREDELARHPDIELVDMDTCLCPREHFLNDCPPDADCLLCPHHLSKPTADKEHVTMANRAASERADMALDGIVDIIRQMAATPNGERTPYDLTAIKALQSAINAAAIAKMNIMEGEDYD